MVSSTDTSWTQDGCPPLEDLAAFLDGRLSGEERARMTAHVADCERCYEVFAGAARFQQDSAPKGSVFPFPFGRRKSDEPRKPTVRWKAIGMVASILLVVGLGALIGYRTFLAQPEMGVAELIEPLQVQEAAKNLYDYDVYRGPGDTEGSFSDRPSFLVGVFLVDLRLGLEVGDAESSANLLQAISKELEEVPLMGEEATRYSDLYLQLKDEARSAGIFRQLQADIPAMEAKLSGDESALSPESLAFGKWTEAARLAAVTRTADFFDKWANRRFLTQVIREKEEAKRERDKNRSRNQETSEAFLEWELEAEREDEVLRLLHQVRDLWKDEDLAEKEYVALAETLNQIIEKYES